MWEVDYELRSHVAGLGLCGRLYAEPHADAAEAHVNGGEPVYTRQTALSASDGKYCVVTFALPSDATKELFGRYTYQITILDGNGNAAIPHQGRMMIYKNIQPDVL